MAAILEIIGWLMMLAVLAALIAITYVSHDFRFLWIAIPWAVACFFFALVVMVFARMLAELQAIREAAERQTAVLADILRSLSVRD